MKKYLPFVSALVLGFFVLGATVGTVRAAGGEQAHLAVEVTKEDVAKKYPMPDGKYPMGLPTMQSTTGGFIQSPYSSRVYDCRKIKKGAYVLDEAMKKVFVRP